MQLNPLFKLPPSERRVLQCIWAAGPVARIDICEQTGLGSATVTRISRELVARGLVGESVLHNGQRGQPARPLVLRPDGAYAFGVYFSHSYMDVGLIDLSGRLMARQRLPFEAATPELILDAARAGLMSLTRAAGIALDRVVGAGFALPGDFDRSGRKLVAHVYFPALQGYDAAAGFAAAMPVPVFVENDGAAAAAGERVNGAGRSFRTFSFIHIGHGVGGSLVLDGRLYRGRYGNSGLTGVLYPVEAPRPSGQDLLESLRADGLDARDFDELDSTVFLEAAATRRWIARAAVQLEDAVRITARLIDPEAVILGGRLPPNLLSALFEALDTDRQFDTSPMLPRPQVLASTLGPDAGVIGAASICIFRCFLEARP